MTCIVKVKKTHPDAVIPTQNQGDVGWDLYSVEGGEIKSGDIGKISTGLVLADTPCSEDIYKRILLKIEGRSGLASKGVFPVGGIIDPFYRGEISVLLYNSNSEKFEFEPGDRVAQIVIYPVYASANGSGTKFLETKNVNSTSRGEKGFGSSGK